MEFNYLINIVNQITNCFGQPRVPYEHELKRELMNLSDFEKQILRNRVNKIDYNIGTLNIIKILKECEVTSITEYLGSISNMHERLLIITEIFDDKSSYKLLEELIDSNSFNDLINESIKNYINDLIHQQDIIVNEIISSTETLLAPEIFSKCILSNLLSNLFLMDFKSVNELTELISNQKDWNLEFSSFRVLRKIFENIMPKHNNVIVKEVINLIQNEKQICWFFILMVIGFVKEEYDGYVELKNLINLHINTFLESSNLNSLYKSFVLSRQLFHYNPHEKKLTYHQWLKSNIGDLNYKLKNKGTFSDIIQNLENVIPFENDHIVLQKHMSCQISAPRKEYSRVLEYKQLIRSREEVLKIYYCFL